MIKVRNFTDRDITISNNFTTDEAGTVILSKNQAEIIYTKREFVSGCDGDEEPGDRYYMDTYEMVPLREKRFWMTVDGEEVSNDIFLRKYWTFEPSTGYGESTYTLTVTDELLASLPEVEE